MNHTYSWNGYPVKMVVPDQQQLEAWAEHLLLVAAEHFGNDIDHVVSLGIENTAHGDHDNSVDGDEDDDEITVDVGRFEHAVWWIDPADCPGSGIDVDDPFQCACGPLTLLAVLEGVDDCERALIVAEHRGEMVRAFSHFWSGEGALAGGDRILDACPGCLIDGDDHVARVGQEAESLAVELGYALAAFDHDLTLGRARYETFGGGD